MEHEQSKGNESQDPFGLRSAIERKMAARGEDPASRARAEAEHDGDVSDTEIADLLEPHTRDQPPDPPPDRG